MASTGGRENVQLVVFTLDQEEFACLIFRVREVIKAVPVTPLPHSLEYVKGVFNLRGEVVPLVDLRRRLSLSEAQFVKDNPIIVVEAGAKIFGLLVDTVKDLIRLPEEEILKTPEELKGSSADLVSGVVEEGERLLIILNLDHILTSNKEIAMEEIIIAGRQLAAVYELSDQSPGEVT